MAYNVISCKQSKRILKKLKSLISQCKFGSRDQKWPEISKKTDHSIVIFSIFFYRYGIFWMPPGESSHPGGSEYVWQRGVEGVLGWVTGGRSLPYFTKKTTTKMQCQKKQIRPQFSKYRFQNESALGHRLWPHTDWFWKQYFENCGRACFFLRLILVDFFFENRVNFGRP